MSTKILKIHFPNQHLNGRVYKTALMIKALKKFLTFQGYNSVLLKVSVCKELKKEWALNFFLCPCLVSWPGRSTWLVELMNGLLIQ